MELFKDAKVVRIQNFTCKYLYAKDDGISVIICEAGRSCPNVQWEVEKLSGVIRLKSCYGKYLTRTKQLCMVGGTGIIVVQAQATNEDSDWVPVNPPPDSSPLLNPFVPYVLLKPRYGTYCLRGSEGKMVSFDLEDLHEDKNDHLFNDKSSMHILWAVQVVSKDNSITAISSDYYKNKPIIRPNNAPYNTNVPLKEDNTNVPLKKNDTKVPNPLQPNDVAPNMLPQSPATNNGLVPYMPTYPKHQAPNIFYHCHFTGRDYMYYNTGNNSNGSGTQISGDVNIE